VKFEETDLAGVWVLEQERRGDARGFFTRTFCDRELAEHGLATRFVQTNLSRTAETHTLRGLHLQEGDAAEDKLVQCVSGRILDVVLDLRDGSQTHGRHVAVELSTENGRMMYVPRGCAHGFLTLEPDALVLYQVSNHYTPEAERGVRWDDPAFAIDWGVTAPHLSEKDAAWPLWRENAEAPR
jgi:dTDP-4-dehydrorhamnose 3,5-epimerase